MSDSGDEGPEKGEETRGGEAKCDAPVRDADAGDGDKTRAEPDEQKKPPVKVGKPINLTKSSTANREKQPKIPNSKKTPPQRKQTSPATLALAALREKSIQHPLQLCQLTLYVQPHTAGAIIGLRGRTILTVQREAMRNTMGHEGVIKISVMNESAGRDIDGQPIVQEEGELNTGESPWTHLPTQIDDLAEEEDWTPVVIRGDPLGCFAAARQLLPLVEGEYDPDIVFDVPINKAKHNQIVGKRGITIAALSATYETRLMVPPNELMSNVGPANYWEARKVAQEQKQNEAGSTLLFGGGNGGSHVVTSVKEALDYGGLEPNIVQLEGEIDNVEKCLVKILGIISGEDTITPQGEMIAVDDPVDDKPGEELAFESATKSVPVFKSREPPSAMKAPSLVKAEKEVLPKESQPETKKEAPKKKDKEPTAEAIIIKEWSATSKLLNLGKIRKVQRKTNTIIRRKKIHLETDKADGEDNDNEEQIGTEEDSVIEDDDDAVNFDEEADPKEDDVAKTATKYIITGKTQNVRSAAAQFEKILDLEPGAAVVTDTTDIRPSKGRRGPKRHPPRSAKQGGDGEEKKPRGGRGRGSGKGKGRGSGRGKSGGKGRGRGGEKPNATKSS